MISFIEITKQLSKNEANMNDTYLTLYRNEYERYA